MRDILESAVRPDRRLRLGTALAERSRRLGLTNEDVNALNPARDRTPAEPMSFE
jgi:plasmid stability protein